MAKALRLESYKILKGLFYRTGQLHVSRYVKNIKPPSPALTTFDFDAAERVPVFHCYISFNLIKSFEFTAVCPFADEAFEAFQFKPNGTYWQGLYEDSNFVTNQSI